MHVLRDWQRHLIQLASTRFMYEMSTFVSEATTVRDGIQAALDARFSHLQIEGDNRLVVQAVQGIMSN